MDELDELAARWGLARNYIDARGREVTVSRQALKAALAALSSDQPSHRIFLPRNIVLRAKDPRPIRLDRNLGRPVHWQLAAATEILARGRSTEPTLALPRDLPHGVYRLDAWTADGQFRETAPAVSAPDEAYQGRDPWRHWLIMVQLYGIRSHRNWGHGDFTDLSNLLEIAAGLGAAGVGLNPVHALLNDSAVHVSPYSPSSRLFLNYLYIDVASVPEFARAAKEDLLPAITRLREAQTVDYLGVAAVKAEALRRCYAQFDKSDPANGAFEEFRQRHGPTLQNFACFEALRALEPRPWQTWPETWRRPDLPNLLKLLPGLSREIAFHEYVQWIADRQLRACRDKAERLGLTIGLYMDVAVGVRPDGADAWSEQAIYLHDVSIGAPPDVLNADGQDWGLTTYQPHRLEQRAFDPFRRMLAATMQYAGAVRIDHVLWLNRLFLVPRGLPPSEGCYLQFPLDALLGALAIESEANRCIVIGEDLGTVPHDLRAVLRDWGVWTYHVMQFERNEDGAFLPAPDYQERALATFSTHDLPPFAAWIAGNDLTVKRAIGLDPGETDAERRRAVELLEHALSESEGRDKPLGFTAVARFLAHSPSRLVAVGLEDVLGLQSLTNTPGTTDQHPNWRQRIPVFLEELVDDERLIGLREVFAHAGRSGSAKTKRPPGI